MTTLRKRMLRTKQAAAVGLLVAVPLLPLTGCGDDGGSGEGGGSEVENRDSGGESEDEGPY